MFATFYLLPFTSLLTGLLVESILLGVILLLPLSFLIILAIRWRKEFAAASAIEAILLWSLLVVFVSELLSNLELLNYAGLLLAWSAITLTTLAILLYSKCYLLTLPEISKTAFLTSALILAMAAIPIYIGLVYPPNNWDSMTYHLARIAHWLYRGSLEHYYSDINRQLYHNPFSELVLLNIIGLSGSDRYANMLQAFAMLATCLTVHKITKELRLSSSTCLLAAVLVASMPMVILQASSTQNDLVCSLFCVICLYYLICKKIQPSWFGLSLGLALLTKGTAYVYCLPLSIAFGVKIIRNNPLPVALRTGIFCGIIVLLLNSQHYLRNYKWFGHPLGEVNSLQQYRNQKSGTSVLFSNLLRNFALQMQGQSSELLQFVQNKVFEIHVSTGINPNDSATTWKGTTFHIPALWNHEDFAGNPIHALLSLFVLIFSIVIIFCRAIGLSIFRAISKETHLIIIILITGAILYCLIFRWQPWASRIHTPWLVMMMPVAAAIFAKIFRPAIFNYILAGVLVVSAYPYFINNASRQLSEKSSEIDAIFYNRPDLKEPYLKSANILQQAGCKYAGLITGEDSWDYPLWVLNKGTGFEYLEVSANELKRSSKSKLADKEVCAVLVIERSLPQEFRWQIGDTVYKEKFRSDVVELYLKSSQT